MSFSFLFAWRPRKKWNFIKRGRKPLCNNSERKNLYPFNLYPCSWRRGSAAAGEGGSQEYEREKGFCSDPRWLAHRRGSWAISSHQRAEPVPFQGSKPTNADPWSLSVRVLVKVRYLIATLLSHQPCRAFRRPSHPAIHSPTQRSAHSHI